MGSMRWVRMRAAASYVAIWLGAVSVGTVVNVLSVDGAAGQSVAPRAVSRLLPGALPTVSVASLRIPEQAWGHFDKAQDAVLAKRINVYERETSKALEIAPNFAQVYLLRATYEVSVYRFDAAIADVLEAQRIEPGVAWAGVILAGAYNGARRFDDAMVIFENLRGAEADAWQTSYERTRTEIGRGDVEAALHWSAIALAAAPESHAEVHLLRAHALSLARRWPAAIAEIETYLQSGSSQPHRAEVLALLERTRSLAKSAASESPAAR